MPTPTPFDKTVGVDHGLWKVLLLIVCAGCQGGGGEFREGEGVGALSRTLRGPCTKEIVLPRAV